MNSAVVREMHLIHYGSDCFLLDRFEQVKNNAIRKPDGGLWTSPAGSEWGWREWSMHNGYRLERLDKFFEVWIKGRIYKIDTVEDMLSMPWVAMDSSYAYLKSPDYEFMRSSGIDAIWLTVNGERGTRLSFPHNLYGWDCETVYIMNPDIILEKSEERIKT